MEYFCVIIFKRETFMRRLHFAILILGVLVMFASCSTTKYVPEGKYLLDDVRIHSDNNEIRSSTLSPYLRQTPNSKWFSLIKTQLYVYNWSGRDTTRWINRTLRRMGDAPVIYDEETLTRYAIEAIQVSPEYPMLIDRHLYETIPSTDFRKNNFIDFAIDGMETQAEKIEALRAYTDYPENVYATGYGSYGEGVGGLTLKFRLAGGAAGRSNQYVGFVQAVPLMRVEEMYLIEAEAAGMQEESRGITLLTNFAKQRDPEYVYGTHNEAYGNNSTSQFQNEVWWQRRVELWGEGFATFDIKRLNKGVIRSYANTNHLEGNRWNTTTPPDWMNLCIVQSETNYNVACTNNPTPIPPSSDSDEFVW